MSYPQFRSECPVASAMDLFGDKWTLVVLRTIFAGRHRFGELLEAPERIATNILSDRLERLEAYHLTERGADLLPVLQALAAWSGKHLPDRWEPPPWFSAGKPADFYPAARVTEA